MDRLRQFHFKLRGLWRDRRREADMAEEMRAHLERLTAANRNAGMSPDQARTSAMRQFGNVASIQERARDERRFRTLEILIRDLHYAARRLRHNRVFALTAILSLALGIGANTAVFTLLHASLWKLLPVEDPDQIVHLLRSKPGSGLEGEFAYSYVLFRELSKAARPFGEVIAKTSFGLRKFGVDGDSSERVVGEAVSANFFSALRVKPAIGRVLQPQDDNRLGGERVAVLSHAFWTRRFQSSPSVLGKTIQYKETPYTVVGVAQPGFIGLEAETSIDVWVPITADAERAWLTNAHTSWLTVLMRLRSGINPPQVQGILDTVFRAHAAREVLPTLPPHFKPILESQHLTVRSASSGLSSMGRRYERPLQLLMAIVALVLLISCANVANLVMARNEARQHEIALRLAIGASRVRIVSQLLIESLLLAVLGAVCGLAVAVWACGLLLSLLPEPRVPLAFNLRPDLTVLGFTTAVAMATAILFGLAPALRAYRASRNRTLNSSRRTTGRSLAGRTLVAGQLAVSLVLLIGAGLFLETIGNLKAIDLGFSPQRLVTFEASFPRGTPAEHVRQTYEQIQERLESRPGVIAVSYSWPGIYEGGGWSSPVEVEGRRAAPGEDNEAAVMAVGPGFFQTIGLALRHGRDFNGGDQSGPPVAVVNESLAKRHFGETSPVGRRIRLPGREPELREIVGVVRDARHYGARGRLWPMVYLPQVMQDSFLVVRSTVDAQLLGPFIRETALAVNSAAQIERIQQVDDLVDRSFSSERLIATLSTSFAVLAAVLAAIGLYGVMAYSLARRTSELGVRMALGAQRSDILWLVFRETGRVLIAGGAIGVAGALASTQLVSSVLYGVKATDGVVFLGATSVLAAVALVAAFLLARRASLIDPMTALRYE
jgi:predicted permease